MPRTNPTVLYGRSDLTALTIPRKDGNGSRAIKLAVQELEGRKVTVLKDKEAIELLIDRDPAIVTPSRDPNVTFSTHWATTPRMVPLTDEEQQQQKAKEESALNMRYDDFQEFQRFKAQQQQRRNPINY